MFNSDLTKGVSNFVFVNRKPDTLSFHLHVKVPCWTRVMWPSSIFWLPYSQHRTIHFHVQSNQPLVKTQKVDDTKGKNKLWLSAMFSRLMGLKNRIRNITFLGSKVMTDNLEQICCSDLTLFGLPKSISNCPPY